jgi:hypothetical protein
MTNDGKVWINDFLKASAEHAAGKRRGEIRPPVLFGEKRGAGEGNRTLIISLEGCMILRQAKGIAAKPQHSALNSINGLRALCKTPRPSSPSIAAAPPASKFAHSARSAASESCASSPLSALWIARLAGLERDVARLTTKHRADSVKCVEAHALRLARLQQNRGKRAAMMPAFRNAADQQLTWPA